MKFRDLAFSALALVGVAGSLTATPAEAAGSNDRIICNPTTGCGPGAGTRGGAATGITDATVWAPVQVYQDTTIENGQLTRDGHTLIPEISIKGRTDLAAYDGRIMTIVVQGIPQGATGSRRIQVRFDATPEGDEIEVQAPRGFERAGIAGLTPAMGGKTLRIAMRACDYGQWIEPPPPPPPPAPEPVVQLPPPPPPAPVIVQLPPPPPPAPAPQPVADAPIAPPRVVGSDAAVLAIPANTDGFFGEIRADGAIGNVTNGTVSATGTYRDGSFWLRGGVAGAGVNGSPLGVEVTNVIYDPVGNTYGTTTEVQGQVDRTVVAPLITAKLGYDLIGSPESVQTGGGYVRVQGGIDPLQGAGLLADNAIVLAGDTVDPLTRSVFAAGSAANVAGAGIEVAKGFGDNGDFSVTARAAATMPALRDTIGIASPFTLQDEAFGTGAHKWNWGLHGSAEARFNLSDNFSLRAGGSYDRFNFDRSYTADVCGNCGFQYELGTKGVQTNITASLGADYTGQRFQASATAAWSRLTNIGGQTVTGQTINGEYSALGEPLVGMNAQGVYGSAKARYDFGNAGGLSGVVRADYGNWDLNRYGTERSATAYSITAGPRYDSEDGRFFVEARAGYEGVDRPDGNKSGPTARVGIGFRF